MSEQEFTQNPAELHEFVNEMVNLKSLDKDEIYEANKIMLDAIEELKKEGAIAFNLDSLHYDHTGSFDIKFGEAFRKTQEITGFKTAKIIARNPELIKLAQIICLEAIQKQATDIQVLKINEELGIVRLRIGQDFIPYRRLHGHSVDALAVVFKDISNCNIEARGIGQGGRFSLETGNGIRYNIRTSFVPTIQGENISARVLYSQNLSKDLSKLGLPREIYETVRKVLRLPEGLILLTGGTGSGKTTTLYTCINEISRYSRGSKNIMTLENPVEYIVNGVVQCPIDEVKGFTFEKGLKHLLRQNPDVILVGEINDTNTAQTSTRASTSGHLVFSTLHTNDVLSVGSVMDYYKVSTLELAWALQLVINQRLVNQLCPKCKIADVVSTEENRWITKSLKQSDKVLTLYSRNPEGCDHCSNHGYVGRALVCSMLDANKEYTELAMKNLTLDVLEETLINSGNTNYYPIEKDVHRHLKEGNIDMITAKSIVR